MYWTDIFVGIQFYRSGVNCVDRHMNLGLLVPLTAGPRDGSCLRNSGRGTTAGDGLALRFVQPMVISAIAFLCSQVIKAETFAGCVQVISVRAIFIVLG